MSSVTPLGGASIAIQLEALEENRFGAELKSGKSIVKVETGERTMRRELEREALEKARAEAEDSSFWGDVASVGKDVAVVASVAGAAFSGGSTLIVAASIAGGALTVGADVAKREELLDDKVCKGLEIAGACATLGAGGYQAVFEVAPAVSETSAVVGLVAGEVESGSMLVAAGASYQQTTAQSRETDAQADAASASSSADAAQTAIDDSISRMQQSLRNRNLTAGTIAVLQQSDVHLNDELINGMRG
jgi:hypothetical protein